MRYVVWCVAVVLLLAACSGASQRPSASAPRTDVRATPSPNEQAATAVSTEHAKREGVDADRYPTAGICGGKPRKAIVTLRAEGEALPLGPRCVAVRPRQRVRVLNNTASFGEGGVPIRVRLAGEQATVAVGEAFTFEATAGAMMQPGQSPCITVTLKGHTACGAEVWLKPRDLR